VPREPPVDPGDAVSDFDPDNPAVADLVLDVLERLDESRADWSTLEQPDRPPEELPPDRSALAEVAADRSSSTQRRRRRRHRRRLRSYPSTRLVIHMSADTFWFDGQDPCRLEDPGRASVPITPEQAREQLGHSRVQIVPVIDLNNMPAVDSYEVTGTLRAAVMLKSAGACPFPFCDSFTRRGQCDHTINWPDGPSAIGNLAFGDPHHHRVKTHSRWQVRQPFTGIYVWKDPHGQYYIVDHRGTHLGPAS
jgi:hypothetical protein